MTIYFCQNEGCNSEVYPKQYSSGNIRVPKACSHQCRVMITNVNRDMEIFRKNCSIAAKRQRKALKENPEKYNAFVKKVKANQKKIWKEREKTGEKQIIINKVSKIIKEKNDRLTSLQRKKKYSRYYTMSEDAINSLNAKGTEHLMKYIDKMPHKSKFTPINPKKYAGDPKNIICRSSWERKFCNYLDTNPGVMSWASEELFVPYYSPIDKKVHRYYPDFLVKTKEKTFMIEIKPKYQTVPPKSTPQKRKTKRYLRETFSYVVNQAKWEAANKYCKKNNMEFKIITENELNILR
jgi:hypothetical protein